MNIIKKTTWLASVLLLVNGLFQPVFANPQGGDPVKRMIQSLGGSLRIDARQYEGTNLKKEFRLKTGSTVTPENNWQVDLNTNKVSGHPEAIDLAVSFKCSRGNAVATAVSVSIDFSKWSRDNYLMVPAIVYNGNRYQSIGTSYNPPYPKEMYYNPNVPLTISNNPRLAIDKNTASVIELQTGNAATPAICFYSPAAKKGFILLTTQKSRLGNHGLTISENAAQDNCSFSVSLPAMRKLATGFGDFHPSGDKAPDWNAGDSVELLLRLYVFDAASIPDLLTKFHAVRKELNPLNQPRNQLPMSQYLQMATTICSNNFITVPAGSYYKPENNNDFQLGWLSGMINTYPMLALNNETERNRVASELDFVVSKLQGKSGYFYGGITADGVLRPEEMNPNFAEPQAMVRKNSDALLWLMKHLLLFKAQGYSSMIKPEWENAAKKLAAAFTATWKKHAEFGQFIAPETGEIAVFNSTAGAIAPAGLAIASDYFKNPEWLQVAKAAANFYYERDVVKQGLTGGDCGDISMDANSESAFGFLESLMALYNYTSDKTWLQKAQVQAALCATWAISYDPVFPANSQIGKLKCHMAGAVWASIQNKHAAPGICEASGDYLFKLYRATGDAKYADLIKDIQHAQAEAVNIPPHHITTNNLVGSSMERIQPSDAEGKGSIGNFINTRNSWTETNGMLMAMELPGIYLQSDKQKMVVFDHVEAGIVKQDAQGTTIAVYNPTMYDASVAVFVETSGQAARPLPYTAFVKWPKATVKAGEKINILVSGKGEVRAL